MHALEQHSGSINDRDSYGDTPLLVAIKLGDHSAVKLLVNWGANVHDHSFAGNLPLEVAVSLSQIDCARTLLEFDRTLAENRRSHSHRPLHVACQEQSIESVKILLEFGADPRHCNITSDTPLHTLARNAEVGNPEIGSIIRILVSHGADIDAKGYGKRVPLHTSIAYNKSSCTAVLLEVGADVRAEDSAMCTIYHYVGGFAILDTMQAVCEAKIDCVDPDKPQANGWTAAELFNWRCKANEEVRGALQSKPTDTEEAYFAEFISEARNRYACGKRRQETGKDGWESDSEWQTTDSEFDEESDKGYREYATRGEDARSNGGRRDGNSDDEFHDAEEGLDVQGWEADGAGQIA